jgi:hypothetical protein
MKTWIVGINKYGASIYMRPGNEEKLSSIDLFYNKPVINRETNELNQRFVTFLTSEIERLCLECNPSDLLLISAITPFVETIIAHLETNVKIRVSKVITTDLRSTPIDYVSQYTREAAESQAS